MCGILGSVNIKYGVEVLNKIIHRGPDAQNIKQFSVGSQAVFFGQTRLAINDLSEAGSQPMISACGNFAIIFNGEIYNHIDLRNKLPEIKFRGHSDTESILYYIAKYGIDSIVDFNGIFAFAFLDIKTQKLFIARDHFGVKPLYYIRANNEFVFSSELKPILNLYPDQVLDFDNLHTFLRLRFCPSPQTLYKNIKKLEPGHYLAIEIADLNKITSKFFSYIPRKNHSITESEALDVYDDLMHKSVKRQLMSDVPIAIMLSGGVDSALLAHIANKVADTKFETFTVGYDFETPANEISDARFTADWLGTKHSEIIIKENDFSEQLARFVEMVEEPIGSQSIFPFYYLSQGIHNSNYKVALSGQGIDEAWAGYGRYNMQNFFETFSSPLWKPFQPLVNFSENDKLRRGFNSLTETNRASRYVESYSFFDKKMLGKLTNVFNEKNDLRLKEFIQNKFECYLLNKHSAVDSMMFLDSRLALSDDLLLYTDKLAMQHSLEVRVPFLDIELMKFTESLPDRFKISFTQNKILHKKLCERHLPREIIYRKKKGFYVPRKEWFKGETGNKFKNILMNDKSYFSEIFNKPYISSLFELHQEGKRNYEDQLYSLLNIYFWFKINFK